MNIIKRETKDRAKWRTATTVVARCRTRLDGTMWQCKKIGGNILESTVVTIHAIRNRFFLNFDKVFDVGRDRGNPTIATGDSPRTLRPSISFRVNFAVLLLSNFWFTASCKENVTFDHSSVQTARHQEMYLGDYNRATSWNCPAFNSRSIFYLQRFNANTMA